MRPPLMKATVRREYGGNMSTRSLVTELSSIMAVYPHLDLTATIRALESIQSLAESWDQPREMWFAKDENDVSHCIRRMAKHDCGQAIFRVLNHTEENNNA